MSYRLTAPLQGLSGDIEEMNFGNGFKIRRISNSEKITYLNQMEMSFPSPFGNLDIMGIEYTLESFYTHHKDTPQNTSNIQRRFKDILTVLRLFKKGRVNFNIIKTEPVQWTLQAGVSYGWNISRQDRIMGTSYKLNKSESFDLLKLWSEYKKVKKELLSTRNGRYINLAIKRFNLGIEESDAENKIIDFFIAFEALCLPERGELTYRLSNRMAILLGKNEEEAEKIRKFMITAYNIRSSIVHGDEIKPITIENETIRLNEFAERVEEYLRKTLKMFLILSKKYAKQEQIMSLLDRSLINAKLKRHLPRAQKSLI